ncbi:hypothetical protein BH10CHL1_BH10CHL1_22310 [soil metagenome]
MDKHTPINWRLIWLPCLLAALLLPLILSTPAHAQSIRDGLLGYWPFDEGSGKTSIDYSGYNNPAVLQSGATLVTIHAITPYLNNGALQSNPTVANSYATVPSYTPSGATVPVIAISDANGLHLYLNGQLAASAPPPNQLHNIPTGVTFSSPRSPFKGLLDDVRIYERALTDAEITALGYTCAGVSEIPNAECQALVSFFFQANGPWWNNHSNWEQNNTPCSWFGVTCTNGHVTALTLDRNNVNGFFSPALGDLTELDTLDLRGNQLIGNVPPELGKLSKLRVLQLGENRLSGTVPGELGQLGQLQVLSLQNNALGGDLPTGVVGLSGHLQRLLIDYNLLTAADPAVIAFLNAKQPGWQNTQTVPPTDLRATLLTSTTVLLEWTPILYTADVGHYEITAEDVSHSSFLPTVPTRDKLSHSSQITNMPVNAILRFRMTTFTLPHGPQQNLLISASSAVVELNPTGNRPPVAQEDSYAGATNGINVDQFSGVLINDSDPEGAILRAVKLSDPLNGTLTLNANGSFAYQPKLGFLGTDYFSYAANDGLSNSAPVLVTLTIHGLNLGPVAAGDVYATIKETPLTVDAAHGVLANDKPQPLQAQLIRTTAHGTLTFNMDGSFTYTPATGFTGDDTFIYRASDGINTSQYATVHIQVNAAQNNSPVSVDDSYTTQQETALTVDPAHGLLANDSDPDGNPLQIGAISSVNPGSKFALNLDGSFVYTPAVGFVGADSFTYQASDGQALSNQATVAFQVKAKPVVNPATITIALDVQPDSKTNFNFTGSLGAFLLDDITPQDRNAYSNSKTFTVPAGTYTVTEVLLNGYLDANISCNPPASTIADLTKHQIAINVASGANLTCTFVAQRAGQIIAGKYNDHNHNHNRNNYDEWLNNWQMQLHSPFNPQPVTQATAGDGRTMFNNLFAGTYTVCEMQQTGWFAITPTVLNTTYNAPCYTVNVTAGQAVWVRFGNSNTPVVSAADVTPSEDIVVCDLPATDDAGNELAPERDPWEEEEQAGNAIFLPLVIR